ncbi:MAG: ABC transporter substrate-binding protein [Desulfobacterium sp.]|nr:ABC transporter substrate-binding protein [Desulfobacterium sp.]
MIKLHHQHYPNRKKSIPHPLFLLALFLNLLFLPGQNAFSDQNVDQATLRQVSLHLPWLHQFQFAGYYAAIEQGYYARAGFKVRIIEGTPGNKPVEEVVSGRAAYGVGRSEILLHRLHGLPLVVLAAVMQHSAVVLLTRADAGFNSPRDLIHRRVMTLNGREAAEYMAMFRREGISLEQLTLLESSFDINDLIKGNTDALNAYSTNEPYTMEGLGVKPRMIRPIDYGVDFYGDCLFTSEAELRKNPDQVKAFRAASIAGWEYAMAHTREMIQLIQTRYGAKQTLAHLEFEAGALKELIMPDLIEIGHMNPKRWDHMARTYVELGMAEPDYSLMGFIYNPDTTAYPFWVKYMFWVSVASALLTGFFSIFLLIHNRRLTTEINRRSAVEKALAASEERYRSMMESMMDAAYICSPDFLIQYVNPRMKMKLEPDPMGKPCYRTIYHQEDKCPWCTFDRVQRGEHVEHELLNPVDNHFYSVTSSPINFSGDAPLDQGKPPPSKLTILRDITQQKALETKLAHSRRMESLGTLTGGIAHDFNNLLYIMMGNAELALENIPESSPAHVNLTEIINAGKRSARIIGQLLSFSRGDNGQLKPMDGVATLGDSLDLIRATLPSSIKIHRELPDKKLWMVGDPDQIRQLLINLCINAFQAMEKTGGTIEVLVDSTTLTDESTPIHRKLPPGRYLRLIVKDTGPGIPHEVMDRVFDPYFTTRGVGKGTGMGLPLTHGIVKNHGGTITVDSIPGQGAIFTILFPLIEKKENQEKRQPQEKKIKGDLMILFVDDEKMITNLMKKALERHGYKVVAMTNPVQALEKFKSEPTNFNLVITDMTMPGMGGETLSREILKIRPDIPIIISTGHSNLMDNTKAKQMGITTYIMKPMAISELVECIKTVLDQQPL